MKIERLELLAYGPFSGKVLDFARRPKALQLVYGPNEAGKSSTLRALTGLLYGIDARTADAHLHAHAQLRVGATLLDETGRSLRVIRRKGLKNTLLDENEQAVSDALLVPYLGGLDQALFKQMFGLDHDRLRQGAEALLAGGGQLGEVLFDASTGGRGVHTLLEQLRAEAEQLYKARGRNAELNVAIDAMRELGKRKDEGLRPDTYALQRRALADAQVRREQMVAERLTLAAEQTRLSRLLALLPVLGKRQTLLAELAQSAALRAPEGVTPLGESSVQALDRRHAVVAAEERELPTRRARMQTLGRELAALRARLGAELAGLQGIDTATRRRLRDLAEERRKLESERAELARWEAGAVAEEARLHGRRAALPEPADLAVLELLGELEREDGLGQLKQAQLELSKLEHAVAQRERKLSVACARDVLLGQPLPSDEQVAVLERARQETRVQREQLDRAARDAEKQTKQLQAKRRELLRAGALVSRSELDAARAAREAAFDRLFGGAAPAASALRAYAGAVQQADALSDRMVHEAQRAAEVGGVEQQLEELAQHGEARAAELAQLQARAQQTDAQWRALAEPFALATLEPAQARSVVAELRQLRDQLREHGQLVERQRALATHVWERARGLPGAQEELRDVLAQLEQRFTAARALRTRELDVQRERSLLAQRSEALASELAQQRARAQRVASELQDGQARYAAELQRIGVRAELSPSELVACFDELSQLAQHEHELANLEAQLSSAAAERASLEHDVRALATRTLTTFDAAASPEVLLAELSRVQRARSEAERDHARQRAELTKLDLQLLELSDGKSLDALQGTIAELDVYQTRARVEQLERELATLDDQLHELVESIGSARKGLAVLEQHSGASEAAEDYEQTLSHARVLARRYIEARLSVSLLSREVERYRSEHQAPVLKRAGELFQRLTLRRYRGLGVDFDDHDQPTLSCLPHVGKPVSISGLSDGTRDQLYLALRIASIERYFERRPPLPLVLDDVLIHFDDARAAAALEVLGDLARRTQVLFFTHHSRMIELAKSALGDRHVVVHELAARGGPRSDGPLFEVGS